MILTSGCSNNTVQRHGWVIGIEKENIEEYKRLHADAWPDVLKQIKKSNIQNYSIYLGEVEKDRFYLFSYLEYTGKNFDVDMAKMAKDKTTQKWWTHTDPLQNPLPTAKPGEHWSAWDEVFHYDGPPHTPDQVTLRCGSIIGIPKENILVYTQLHAATWPGVLSRLELCNIRNYSIYLGKTTEDEHLLFSCFEYVGDDFEADMKNMANEVTLKWWTYTDPLQRPLPARKKGEHWSTIEQVFFTE